MYMNISESAMKNHKKLFPEIGIENTLDDELMEILLNFNFDEVQKQDHLDEKTRQMVILACTIASQTPKRYEVFVKAALNVGVTPVEIKEILYQAIPYVGVLKVLDLLEPTNKILVILLSQSGLEPQLKGHIQGNLNVGNDKQKLLDVVTALLPYIGYPRSLNAIRCIEEL